MHAGLVQWAACSWLSFETRPKEMPELVLRYEALHLVAIDCEKALPADLLRRDDSDRLFHERGAPFASAAAIGGTMRDEEQIDRLGASRQSQVPVPPREFLDLQIGEPAVFGDRDARSELADLFVEDHPHAARRLGVALEKGGDAFSSLHRWRAACDPGDFDDEFRRAQEPRGLHERPGIGQRGKARRRENAARGGAEGKRHGESAP